MGPVETYVNNLKTVKKICNDRKCILIRNLDGLRHVKDVTKSRTIDTLHKKMLFSAIARLHCGLNNRNLSFIP